MVKEENLGKYMLEVDENYYRIYFYNFNHLLCVVCNFLH